METYLGQILMTGFDFAPFGFALCDGSLLSIKDFDALYSLIGTTYGGDGVTTFAVPDLRGRIPVHRSLDPSKAAQYGLGQSGGARSVTLLAANLPRHFHAFFVSNSNGTRSSPVDGIPTSCGRSAALILAASVTRISPVTARPNTRDCNYKVYAKRRRSKFQGHRRTGNR